MTMGFPTAIANVELDAAPNRPAAVYTDRRVPKVGSGFAVPGAELDDVDFLSGSGNKMFAEISGEPARL